MRARIDVDAQIAADQFAVVAQEIRWWPTAAQDSDIVVRATQEILDTVSEEDRPLARDRHRFTLSDPRTKSWAIVSEPNDGTYVVRIRNQHSRRLKQACENFVRDLQNYNNRKTHSVNVVFEFPEEIVVLQPNSQHHAYFGQVLPNKWLGAGIRERRLEFITGLLTGTAFLFLAALIFPGVDERLFGDPDTKTYVYLTGMIGRLATSVLVTAFVAWLTVLLHGLDIRRNAPIRWGLEAGR
ncbi:MAG: hypothetical protein WD904_00765 [Dehalococcoidia bacterium]